MRIAANARALRQFFRDGALRWRQRQIFIEGLEAIMRERNSNSRMPKPVVYDGRLSTPYGIACGDGPQGRP
jgi:hypothetical protein